MTRLTVCLSSRSSPSSVTYCLSQYMSKHVLRPLDMTPTSQPEVCACPRVLTEAPSLCQPCVAICVCMGGGKTLLLDNFRGSAGFRISESSPLSIMMNARLGRWSSLTFISRQVQAGARAARSTQQASLSQLLLLRRFSYLLALYLLTLASGR